MFRFPTGRRIVYSFVHVTLLLLLLLLFLTSCRADFNQAGFDEVIARYESDVLELAEQVEYLLQFRCDTQTLQIDCTRGNYDHCLSRLPSPQCMDAETANTKECGNGTGCGTFYDYNVSSVRILQSKATGVDSNPEDQRLIESICFTRKLDDWFKEKRRNDTSYWATRGTGPLHMYFGSMTGAYRIYPGRPSKHCNFYDPRLRPWYLAASSGPKNLVLVLDVSASMKDRIEQLKWATKRIVQPLSSNDYIAIILYHSTASVLGNFTSLIGATEEHKELLEGLIDKIGSYGLTNFYDAFSLAFDVLNATFLDAEKSANCNNTGIIFLTDGEMTYPEGKNENDVLAFVQQRLPAFPNNEEILWLTYAISDEGSKINEFPAKLACDARQGVYTRISKEEDISDVLPNYHHIFAMGLGYLYERAARWSEPYNFTTGGNLGITVSASVHDRSDPTAPIFLGVVGIDVVLESLMNDLDGSSTGDREQISLAKLVQDVCHPVRLEECQLASFRNDMSICPTSCTEIKQVSISLCEKESPTALWNNNENKDVDYTDRACCRGETISLDQCLAGGSATGIESDMAIAPDIAIAQFTRSPTTPTTGSPLANDPTSPAAASSDADSGANRLTTIISVVGALLGCIVSLIFILDYSRNGCWCCDRSARDMNNESVEYQQDLVP